MRIVFSIKIRTSDHPPQYIPDAIYGEKRFKISITTGVLIFCIFLGEAQSLNSRSLSVHNSLSNQDVRQSLYPLPLNRARSNLLSCVNGLSDAVNAITIPNEIEILTKRINQILNGNYYSEESKAEAKVVSLAKHHFILS